MSDREMSKDEALEEAAQSPTASASPPTLATADLLRTATDPALTEDFALALLKRADLPPEIIEQLAKNTNALKSRKAKIGLARHPHTPRHVSIPLARQFYTFDLMKVALSPNVPADVKATIDNMLISRLKTLTLGERITLARRATGRVAAALLLDVERGEGKTGLGKVNRKGDVGNKDVGKKKDAPSPNLQHRVMQIALENPRLTEALVITSVLHPQA